MKTAALLLLAAAAVTLRAADLSGAWEARVSGGQLKDARRVKLTPKDGKYEWTFLGSHFSGAVKGKSVAFECTEDSKSCGQLTGRITGSGISGTGTIDGIALEWSLRRPAPRPAAGPAHYEFTPTVFYREFSGTKDPVLHLFPGDTVHTQTVDAGERMLRERIVCSKETRLQVRSISKVRCPAIRSW